MTRRPRFPDELFEFLDDKRKHKNQNLGDVLVEEFPEIEDELEKNKRSKEESLFEGGGLLD